MRKSELQRARQEQGCTVVGKVEVGSRNLRIGISSVGNNGSWGKGPGWPLIEMKSAVQEAKVIGEV